MRLKIYSVTTSTEVTQPKFCANWQMKIEGVNNKFLTSKQANQATHYTINTIVKIFIFSPRECSWLICKEIFLGGLGWSTCTVRKTNPSVWKMFTWLVPGKFVICLISVCYQWYCSTKRAVNTGSTLVFTVTQRKINIKTIEQKQSRVWDIRGD